jgi:hypothetical protein
MFDKAMMAARKKTATVLTPGGVITIRQPTVPEFRAYLKSLRGKDGKAVAEVEAETALASIVCEDTDGSRLFSDSDEVAAVLAPGELVDVMHATHELIWGAVAADPIQTPSGKPAS